MVLLHSSRQSAPLVAFLSGLMYSNRQSSTLRDAFLSGVLYTVATGSPHLGMFLSSREAAGSPRLGVFFSD